MDFLILIIGIYFLCFVFYWKWVFLRRFVMTSQMREDFDTGLKWIFAKALSLLRIKLK